MGKTFVGGKEKYSLAEKKEVLIIKIFHQTMIFFNEVLFTSYCCVRRYVHKRKK